MEKLQRDEKLLEIGKALGAPSPNAYELTFVFGVISPSVLTVYKTDDGMYKARLTFYDGEGQFWETSLKAKSVHMALLALVWGAPHDLRDELRKLAKKAKEVEG